MGLTTTGWTRFMHSVLCVSIFLLAAGGASPVCAQTTEEAEARRLFDEGTRAVAEGRFTDAERDLSRSYALLPRPPTAFNLVVALRGLGAMVRAERYCRESLEAPDAGLDPARAAEAAALCREVRARAAELVIRATGEEPFELRVDGRSLGQLVPPEERSIPIDPGDHRIRAVIGERSVEHTVTLPPGGRLATDLRGPSPPSDVPLIVGVAGAIVAVLAAGVVVGVVASSPSGPTYDYPVISTLLSF